MQGFRSIRGSGAKTALALVLAVVVAAVTLTGMLVASSKPAQAQTAVEGDLIISEFRLHGPNGNNDEFIEIYNNSDTPHVVTAASGLGYAVVADDGIRRFRIPNGTIIPAHGHFLGVNSVGYSLASYRADNNTTATGDETYTTNITSGEPRDPGAAPLQGIALFNNDNGNFTSSSRLDAVGFESTSNSLYKEGSGIPDTTFFATQHTFYRDLCTRPVGSNPTPACTASDGKPLDTNDNAEDFLYADETAVSAGAGQRLGVPGPENRSSPVLSNGSLPVSLIDPAAGPNAAPNIVRGTTSDVNNNSFFGTVDIRRKITNNTDEPVTRLRVRIIDITTSPPPSGLADLRARTSTTDNSVPLSGGGTTAVEGTTLETPPNQGSGGGFNSSLSANSVTVDAPLDPGESINLRFLFGVQRQGDFRVAFNVEALGPDGSPGAPGKDCGDTQNFAEVCGYLSTAPPVANADPTTAGDPAYTTGEDTPLTVSAPDGILANDTEAENDTLEVADGDTADTDVTGEVDPVNSPSHGTLVLKKDGSFTYTPEANFNGTDTFTYKATNGTLESNIATVSITVDTENDTPTATGDSYSVPEKQRKLTVPAASGVLENDPDPDSSDTLTVSLVSGPTKGKLKLKEDGSFVYTKPKKEYERHEFGGARFVYEVSDGNGETDRATVRINKGDGPV